NARVRPSTRTSAGCAPEMAYFPPSTKNGTPVMPSSRASDSSSRTSAGQRLAVLSDPPDFILGQPHLHAQPSLGNNASPLLVPGWEHGLRTAGEDGASGIAHLPWLHDVRRPFPWHPQMGSARRREPAVPQEGAGARHHLLRHRQRLLPRRERGDTGPS